MNKLCNKCNKEKSLEEFYKHPATKDGYDTQCKECTLARMKITSRAYRIKNKERVKLMVKDWVQRNRNKVNESGRRNARKRYYRNKSFVKNYLSTHPCIDCGETDPVVLQFDHVRGIKKFNIANSGQKLIKTIEEEISKCEVRCAHCHLRKHHTEKVTSNGYN